MIDRVSWGDQRHVLATALQTLHMHEPAVECFQTLVGACGPSVPVLNQLARSLHSLERTAEAVEWLTVALDLHPEHVETLLNLGGCHVHLGNFDVGYRCCHRACGGDTSLEATPDRMLGYVKSPPALPRSTASVLTAVGLVGSRHLPLALFSYRSLMECFGGDVSLVLFDDGTLSPTDTHRLRAHFPDAAIIRITRPELYELVGDRQACRRFIDCSVLATKLFGILTLPRSCNDRVMLVDSDVLWFRTPTTIRDWAESSDDTTLFNCDSYADSTALSPEEWHDLGLRKTAYFNTGLVCTLRDLFDLDLAERILSALWKSAPPWDTWVWEQTVWAGIACRGPAAPLDSSYSFVNNIQSFEERLPIDRVTTRHYSLPKTVFFAEGVDHLMREGRFTPTAVSI